MHVNPTGKSVRPFKSGPHDPIVDVAHDHAAGATASVSPLSSVLASRDPRVYTPSHAL
jgi:hypothetical protein